MRVGSLVFATEQGLGRLAKDFYDNGVVTDVMVVRHGRRPERDDWYPGSERITYLKDDRQLRKIMDFCQSVDVMLFFETPFVWTLFDWCKYQGKKTVLMPMYECMPKVLPTQPDLFLCPSLLDYQYYPCEITSDGSDELLPARLTRKSIYLPVPVQQRWYQRTKAEVFVHNAGHGGLKGRNGTQEFLESITHVKSDAKFVLRVQDDEFAVEKRLLDRVKDRLMIEGTLPYDQLFMNGDVFVFPEKFNGLSLPLQEARAAGMLVMSTDRFPMNMWLPDKMVCPGCDGEGSLMYQWAKAYSVKHGGSRKTLPDGAWYYVTGEGKGIGFKTIGGDCTLCRGKKTANPLIPVRATRIRNISPRLNDFDEAVIEPQDLARHIDAWYGADITEYSLQGREWAKQNLWEVLKPKYMEILEGLVKS